VSVLLIFSTFMIIRLRLIIFYAVSSSSLVNLALVFVLAVMSHLDQKSVL
jgi:hypothetical protein